jgi:hypothetical protein
MMRAAMPNGAALVDALVARVPGSAARNTILIDNPAELHGF